MAETTLREKVLALAKKGVFIGRKNLRPVARGIVVKARHPGPLYGGEHEVASITLGKDTVQVRYRRGIRNFEFETLADVFVLST